MKGFAGRPGEYELAAHSDFEPKAPLMHQPMSSGTADSVAPARGTGYKVLATRISNLPPEHPHGED